jgi:hypothetical protein
MKAILVTDPPSPSRVEPYSTRAYQSTPALNRLRADFQDNPTQSERVRQIVELRSGRIKVEFPEKYAIRFVI